MSALCLLLGFLGGIIGTAVLAWICTRGYDIKKTLPNGYSIVGWKSEYTDDYILNVWKNDMDLATIRFNPKDKVNNVQVTWQKEE